MKACDVVTKLRADVEQWRARAIQAEGPGHGHIAEERRALLEAAAALVGRNAYNCTVRDIVGDLEALRAQRAPTAGHDQIECQRAEIERLRADLARVVAERDTARGVERAQQVALGAHKNAARELALALYGEVKGGLDIPATMRAAEKRIAALLQDYLTAERERRAALRVLRDTQAVRDELRLDIASAKAECADAVQAAAVGEAVIAALNGEVVSDFMASHAPVQQAMDMRLTCDLLRADVEAQRRVILDACAALGVTDDDEADWPKLACACAALKRDLARAEAERADALARAEQAEAALSALADYRDRSWRGGAAMEGRLMGFAQACFSHKQTGADADRVAALALYDEIAPRLDADDPRRRTVEQLRALLTGGPNAD